jgi:hypothetical protein
MPPFPILRYLTPENPVIAPEDFTLIDNPITTGLPFAMRLDGNLSLLLVIPTGNAVLWRDAFPTAMVSQGSDDYETVDPTQPPTRKRPPLRLLVRQAERTLAAVPLLANSIRTIEVPEGTRSFDLLILNWDIRAGTVRGAGDFGSRITLAWRWADEAVSEYSTPPVNPAVEIRQPPEKRKKSDAGNLHYDLRLVSKMIYVEQVRSYNILKGIK